MGNVPNTRQISKHALIIGALGLWAAFTLPLLTPVFSDNAAELQQFALESTPNGPLQVKLQTNGTLTPKVVYGERGATIQLPGASLSQSLIQRGLPVVMDNRNTTIGRAVPQKDGSVAIVLPNVSKDTPIEVTQTRQAVSASVKTVASPIERSQAGHFAAAAKAAQTRLNTPDPIIAPVRNTPFATTTEATNQPDSSTVAPQRQSRPSVALRPATGAARRRPLPRVVPIKAPTEAETTTVTAQPTPQPAAAPQQPTVIVVPQGSGYPPLANGNSAYPSQNTTGYSADTSWFQAEQLPEWAGNAYGVLGVDETVDLTTPVTPPEPSGWGDQIGSFLDRISGNRFSQPYGVAFWGMVMGVLLLAGGGFVLIAIAVLVARLAFRPSAFMVTKRDVIPEPTTADAATYGAYVPRAGSTLPYATPAANQASAQRSPFRHLSPMAPPQATRPLRATATAPHRTTLWDRLKQQPTAVQAKAASPYAEDMPPVTQHSAPSSSSLRQRLKPSTSAKPAATFTRSMQPPTVTPMRTAPTNVDEAISTILPWL